MNGEGGIGRFIWMGGPFTPGVAGGYSREPLTGFVWMGGPFTPGVAEGYSREPPNGVCMEINPVGISEK